MKHDCGRIAATNKISDNNSIRLLIYIQNIGCNLKGFSNEISIWPKVRIFNFTFSYCVRWSLKFYYVAPNLGVPDSYGKKNLFIWLNSQVNCFSSFFTAIKFIFCLCFGKFETVGVLTNRFIISLPELTKPGGYRMILIRSRKIYLQVNNCFQGMAYLPVAGK